MVKKCPDCGSLDVEEVFDGEAYCKNCYLHCSVFDLEYATVFDRITPSPEVLAPYFVFLKALIVTNINPQQQWISTITEEVYPTKEEAIAATVKKLKEVCDGNKI